MTNEVVLTFKGEGPNAPWLVVHAEPELIDSTLDQITGDLLAKAHSLDAIWKAAGYAAAVAPSHPAAQVVQQPAVVQQQAPAVGAPWDVPGATAPAYTPAQQAAVDGGQGLPPTEAAPAAPTGLPRGCQTWVAPNPNPGKEQYTELHIEFPFVQGAAGTALRNEIKGLRSFFSDAGGRKVWLTKPENEAQVHAILNKYRDQIEAAA